MIIINSLKLNIPNSGEKKEACMCDVVNLLFTNLQIFTKIKYRASIPFEILIEFLSGKRPLYFTTEQ